MEQGQWPVKIWDTIEQSGLTRLFVSEAEGGASATWEEGLPVMLAAARTLLPVPFIDTAFCAGLLSRLGLAVPDGPLALADLSHSPVATQDKVPTLTGTLPVAWGRYASHILVRAATEIGRAHV